ncbi:hypothetical protein ACJX0J_021474, partial [Zea mays]
GKNTTFNRLCTLILSSNCLATLTNIEDINSIHLLEEVIMFLCYMQGNWSPADSQAPHGSLLLDENDISVMFLRNLYILPDINIDDTQDAFAVTPD